MFDLKALFLKIFLGQCLFSLFQQTNNTYILSQLCTTVSLALFVSGFALKAETIPYPKIT
jgi:hypothetical protein